MSYISVDLTYSNTGKGTKEIFARCTFFLRLSALLITSSLLHEKVKNVSLLPDKFSPGHFLFYITCFL